MTPSLLISAAWLAPIDRPPLRDGAVVITGPRITAVGPESTLRKQYPSAPIHPLGASILLPGLINAHAHLELSHLHPGHPPKSFVDWLLTLVAAARPGAITPQSVADAISTGVAQSLRFGVTTVGDITKQCPLTRSALAAHPLRILSFGEIQAMAQRRILLDDRFAAAADLSLQSDRLTISVSPHAPYTVEPPGFHRCLEFSRIHSRPIATHLAESPEESEFLAHGTGPFRHLWETGINAWDDHVPRYAGGPVRFARDIGLLDQPTLLAHVNYCDDAELAILAAGRASVVYCPRTHAYFGHPPHRWRDMLRAGINLALGTDSCASSPHLNLLDDLRLLRRLAPEIPAPDLWRLITLNAARALGQSSDIGSLTPGKFADLAAFPVSTANPLEEILAQPCLPTSLWIAGDRVSPPAPKTSPC